MFSCHLELFLPSSLYGFSIFIEEMSLGGSQGGGCRRDYLQFGRDILFLTTHKSRKYCGQVGSLSLSLSLFTFTFTAGGAPSVHPEEGGGDRLHLPDHAACQPDLQRGGRHGDGRLVADRPRQQRERGRGQESHSRCHALQEVLCQQGLALQAVQVMSHFLNQ